MRQKRGRLAVGRIASEALIERLADWGVDTVFGPPGIGRSAAGESSSCPATWPRWRSACRMPSASSTPSPAARSSAFVGDGGFAMLMAEFLTAIKHKLPVKIVINNNNSLGQILREQMVLGYPEHGVRYPEPFVDYTAFATANGALGIKVERSKDVHKAIERVLGHDGPALADVNVNPDEPPLLGKVEYQQAKKFAEAFLRGKPRKATIASTLFRDKIEQLRG